MRYCRVLVKSGDGKRFFARMLDISVSHAVLRGDYVLPAGMLCDLQLMLPPAGERQPARILDMQAVVDSVYFASGAIRLELKIKSLGNDVRRLIESLPVPAGY